MADLKRYDRREAAAGAIYQYRALQDPRDANGIRQKVSLATVDVLQTVFQGLSV